MTNIFRVLLGSNSNSRINFETNVSSLCSSTLAHFLSELIFHHSTACVKCETQVSYKANLVTCIEVSLKSPQPRIYQWGGPSVIITSENDPIEKRIIPWNSESLQACANLIWKGQKPHHLGKATYIPATKTHFTIELGKTSWKPTNLHLKLVIDILMEKWNVS